MDTATHDIPSLHDAFRSLREDLSREIVGQAGRAKPSIRTPVEGLWIVGCDAGGTGVGTQQAIESGYVVAEAVLG